MRLHDFFDIWTPEAGPPQVDGAVKAKLNARIHEEGVIPLSNAALDSLQTDQEALGTYLDVFGFDLNKRSEEGFWPERALKVGASLAFLAYRETGYAHTLDETLEITCALAELNGIPQAYFSSLFEDANLQSLMTAAGEDRSFRPLDDQGIQQISMIGAGCVRFHIQNALLAA